MVTRTIIKQLAGMEDLATGIGPVQQQRAGVSVAIGKMDVPYAVLSEADLKALDVSKFTYARLNSFDYLYDPADSTGVQPSFGSGSWLINRGGNTSSMQVLSARPNMLQNSHLEQPSPTGLIVPPGGGNFNAGDEVWLGVFVSAGDITGLSRDPVTKVINSTTGSVYWDVPKSGSLTAYTGPLVSSWGDNEGNPTEDTNTSIANMGTFYRVTLTPNGCFSAKLEQGVVASRHEAKVVNVKTYYNTKEFGASASATPTENRIAVQKALNHLSKGDTLFHTIDCSIENATGSGATLVDQRADAVANDTLFALTCATDEIKFVNRGRLLATSALDDLVRLTGEYVYRCTWFM